MTAPVKEEAFQNGCTTMKKTSDRSLPRLVHNRDTSNSETESALITHETKLVEVYEKLEAKGARFINKKSVEQS